MLLRKERQRLRQHGGIVQRDADHRFVAEHEPGRIEFEGLADIDVADLDVAAELAQHLQTLVDGRWVANYLDHDVGALTVGEFAHRLGPVLGGGHAVDIDYRVGAERGGQF